MISMGQPKGDTPQRKAIVFQGRRGEKEQAAVISRLRGSTRNFADRPCCACRQAKHANQDREDGHEPAKRQEPPPYRSIFFPLDHFNKVSATDSASRSMRVSRGCNTGSASNAPAPPTAVAPTSTPAPSRNPICSRSTSR